METRGLEVVGSNLKGCELKCYFFVVRIAVAFSGISRVEFIHFPRIVFVSQKKYFQMVCHQKTSSETDLANLC